MTERNENDATGTDRSEATESAERTAESEHGDAGETGDLPTDVAREAERLTHLAREAIDDAEAAAYREERASLLAEHDYTARIREDDTRDVLVLHPEEWVEDGLVQVERIEDLDRGAERPLGGPGEGDDWAEIDAHNRAIAERVTEEHGEVHGANAAAFAAFMSNHYARPIESATQAEIEEFVAEYFPRNAWPSEKQREVVDESVGLAIEAGDVTGSLR